MRTRGNEATPGKIRGGEVKAHWSANYTRILRYSIELWHDDLHAHKIVSAPDEETLQSKVEAQIRTWERKYAEALRRSAVSAGRGAAEQLAVEAEESRNTISRLLANYLSTKALFDWDSLKDNSAFEKTRFLEAPPRRSAAPRVAYAAPSITFWDKIFGRKGQKLADANAAYENERAAAIQIDQKLLGDYDRAYGEWVNRKEAHENGEATRKYNFELQQYQHNMKVFEQASRVVAGEPEALVEYATLILERSDGEDFLDGSFEIEFSEEDKTLLVEYQLPSPEQIPTLKSARFVLTTGEIKETHISEREKKGLFDSVCYQICLRTADQIFSNDAPGHIQRVLFNGLVGYVDPASGQDVTACIMSVLVDRIDFTRIDLARIDPKACFKSLKGVSASSLAALAPVPPVLEFNRNDRRFIEAKNTLQDIDSACNLAAMDWEEFEHLVRELFEKEFAARGGEVRVTQSSSDGGVDAVAFDPDPITGGKIVIQAKRYTRTVGVSAVRDLYGTMQHEGASRGVLITTADYGPDAYKFAAGKPITLFGGANLLHLLERHGYNAKIDLAGARKAMNLR